jgi:hypothetical protein
VRITLNWQGPIGPGRFPTDDAAFERWLQPGIYLRIKRYESDRLVGYVGQSRSVLARIDQHMVALIGLTRPLRDCRGQTVFGGDAPARFRCLNDLDAALDLVRGEAGRLNFYVAICDENFDAECLAIVEAALKARMEDRVAAQNGGLVCENRVAVPGGAVEMPVSIAFDAALLDAPDTAIIERLIGAGDIVLEPLGDMP